MSQTSQPPPAKRFKASVELKSARPDVKVCVGKGTNKSIHYYHATQLASQSPWIDELLCELMCNDDKDSSSTKDNDGAYELPLFEDIETEHWLKMTKFLFDTAAARAMTTEEAMDVAPMYHKYEFVQGLKLCDSVLLEYLAKARDEEDDEKSNIDLVISAAVAAHNCHLPQASDFGREYVKEILLQEVENMQPWDLSSENVRELVPLIEELVQEDPDLLEDIFPSDAESDLESADDIKQATFPRFYALEWKISRDAAEVRSRYSSIHLSSATIDDNSIDGIFTIDPRNVCIYKTDKTFEIDGDEYKIHVQWPSSHRWVIGGVHIGSDDEPLEVFWEASSGRRGAFPPKTGWKSVHPLATGDPVLLLRRN